MLWTLWDHTRQYPSSQILQTFIYWITYTLPLLAKYSKSLQTKQLDLSVISSLIDVVLHVLDDAITPATYWVLELLDSNDDLQRATGEIFNADKTPTFE